MSVGGDSPLQHLSDCLAQDDGHVEGRVQRHREASGKLQEAVAVGEGMMNTILQTIRGQ